MQKIYYSLQISRFWLINESCARSLSLNFNLYMYLFYGQIFRKSRFNKFQENFQQIINTLLYDLPFSCIDLPHVFLQRRRREECVKNVQIKLQTFRLSATYLHKMTKLIDISFKLNIFLAMPCQ